MTTLVVVAVNDFALRVESDDPGAPAWLLHCALEVQSKLRTERHELMCEVRLSTLIQIEKARRGRW